MEYMQLLPMLSSNLPLHIETCPISDLCMLSHVFNCTLLGHIFGKKGRDVCVLLHQMASAGSSMFVCGGGGKMSFHFILTSQTQKICFRCFLVLCLWNGFEKKWGCGYYIDLNSLWKLIGNVL